MKHVFMVLASVAFFLIAQPVYATQFLEAGASARPAITLETKDNRPRLLGAYLESKNSPISEDAHVFVEEADRLGLDWKLVAAISGVESTFGKHIPSNSYNAWGWGIPTGAASGIGFASWSEGITTVSEGLKFRYIDRGATSIEAIGRIYAASPLWSTKVRWILADMDRFVTRSTEALAMTI